MDIGEPPPDPFAGMNSAERKRAQERAILEMAFDLEPFSVVLDSERPDFTICRGGKARPFGVEVTQMFPDDAHARLRLVHGYYHRLWSGGTHLHKQDVKVLQSVTVQIRDPDGNIKQSEVPAILTESLSPAEFRQRLRDVINGKAAKDYDAPLEHLDLVILDWFDLPFDGDDYSTEALFDDDVRAALLSCPFREVFLIISSARSVRDRDSEPADGWDRRVIPLQQLLIMERVFLTGHIVDRMFPESLEDVAHLNRLVVDHVTRVQGYGNAVLCEDRPFIAYRGTLVEISERGVQVRDHQDFPVSSFPSVEVTGRLSVEEAECVAAEVSRNVFACGYSQRALRPSTWLEP